MKTKLLSLAIVASCISLQAQENHIVNGGFEMGKIVDSTTESDFYDFSFKAFAGMTYSLSKEEAREGKQSAKIEIEPGVTMSARFTTYLAQKNITLRKSATTTTLTFFVKSNKDVTFQAYLEGYTTAEQTKTTAGGGANSNLIIGNNTWQTATINIPAKAFSNDWDFTKPFTLSIGFNPTSTFVDGATIFVDDVYLRRNVPNIWINTSNLSFESKNADGSFSGISISKTDLAPYCNLVSDDVVHLTKANKIDIPSNITAKTIETFGLAPRIVAGAKMRLTYYAKSSDAGQFIQSWFKFAGKTPGQENIPLTTEWEKYSILCDVTDALAAKNLENLSQQRISFSVQPGNTYLDHITMDSLTSNPDGTLRYVAPVIGTTPANVVLALDEASAPIKPEITAMDYVFVAATCDNKDLVIENKGRDGGVVVESAKDGTYNLKLTYTDNLTTLERTVSVIVGSGTSTQERTQADNAIVEGKDGYISLRNIEGSVAIYNSLGMNIATVAHIGGEQTVNVSGSAVYIVKFSDGSAKSVFVK